MREFAEVCGSSPSVWRGVVNPGIVSFDDHNFSAVVREFNLPGGPVRERQLQYDGSEFPAPEPKHVVGSRSGQSLQSDGRAIHLAVDVISQVFGNLQDAPLDLALFQTCHAVEGEDRKTQQRQRQGQRKQDEKGPQALGWNAVDKEARRHEALA